MMFGPLLEDLFDDCAYPDDDHEDDSYDHEDDSYDYGDDSEDRP